MSTVIAETKDAIHNKLESQIKSAESKLDTLKARAGVVKAAVEIKAIADLTARKIEIHRKLEAFKKTNDGNLEKAKKEVESLVAGFEKSVKEIEAKVKAH
jgi:hypothetical protein